MFQSSLVLASAHLEMARLDPFDVGQIIAHAHHGLSAPKIAKLVFKTDGSNPCKQAVHDVLTKHEEDPDWRGERAEGSAAPHRNRSSRNNTVWFRQQNVSAPSKQNHNQMPRPNDLVILAKKW